MAAKPPGPLTNYFVLISAHGLLEQLPSQNPIQLSFGAKHSCLIFLQSFSPSCNSSFLFKSIFCVYLIQIPFFSWTRGYEFVIPRKFTLIYSRLCWLLFYCFMSKIQLSSSKKKSKVENLPSYFILENGKSLPIEVVINLILVNEGGREAFLYESANHPENPNISIKILQELFGDNFTFTLENETAQRYLITKKNVNPVIGGEDYEQQLGKILGFSCPGAFDKRKTEVTFAIDYVAHRINKPKSYPIQITAEICDKQNTGEKEKIALWNKILNKYNYQASFTVQKLIPDSLLFNAITLGDSKFLAANWNEFVQWASGGFLSMWQSRLKRIPKNQAKKFVSKDSAFLLLQADAKIDQKAVLQSYYPLTMDEFKIDSQLKKTLVKKYIAKIRVAKNKADIAQQYQRDYITGFFNLVIKDPKDLEQTLHIVVQ